MASIIEIQTDLQKLTNRKITYTEMGKVWGTKRATVSARANNKAMLKAAKQNQKDLEFVRQNAWQVPEGYFEKIRSQITKNPTSVKMQGLRKEDSLLEE